MKKVIVAIPHSHTWMWSQICTASLVRNPPLAEGCEVEIVVIDNSPWSPAIRGICDTMLGDGVTIIPNSKTNKFHASALDCVVEDFEFDYLMALETDVLALQPTWLQWFMDKLRPMDFAVGMFHHESFINPSCTLYQGDVLRRMLSWCLGDGKLRLKHQEAPQDELRWGPDFSLTAPLDNNLPLSENSASVLQGMKDWIAGPFAEKRGWPAGTVLKEQPSGQLKGPGWYEPGQQLHHWAVDAGYTYTVCGTQTEYKEPGLPTSTRYGDGADMQTMHMWGGTRALDILKHLVTCGFVKKWTPFWLEREARFWSATVPPDVQVQTLDLIRKYGWYYRGQGSDHISDRDREAAAFVRECYAVGGVTY